MSHPDRSTDEDDSAERQDAADSGDAAGEDATLPPQQPSEMATMVPDEHTPIDSGSLVGTQVRYFGDYELLDEIARGGMRVVYRARQLSLNRIVALKIILAGQIAGEDKIRRFQLEAEAAASLDHPGIVPIYDIGEHKGQQYFSMELIEGKTLGELSDELTDDHSRAIRLVTKFSEAIHHAHQRGILHRDLKPGNVLVDSNDDTFVTDFGLARQTESDQQFTATGAVLGTPGFMPPEQASGAGVTTAADIYSLGAILYQLLCGRPPHQKGSALDTLMSVINEPPEKPRSLNQSIAPDLELICLKCLARDPEQRYASAAEFNADLHAFTVGEPLSVRAPSIVELTRMWLASNYGSVIRVPIIAIVVGAISGFSLWSGTMGSDLSYQVDSYSHFPDSDQPFLAINWRPLQNYALPFSLLLAATMGWATVKLVRTKNRSADLGAGLSVGLLAGLCAFVAGMGPLFIRTVTMGNDHDLNLVTNLALDNDEFFNRRTLELYPTLEGLPPGQRVQLIANKISADQSVGHLMGTWFGAAICLTMYGILGAVQTCVAGPLIRNRSVMSGFTSYVC